jgi:membrane fusion protein (multidrug efflux system)
MKKLVLLLGLVLVLGAAAAGFYYSNSTPAAGPAEADGQAADDQTVLEAANTEENDGEETESAVPVNVVNVSVGSISTYLTATANLVPEDEVKVLAEAEGRVTQLLVEEGDSVRAGQLLATLLHDEAQIAYDKAEVKTSNAEMVYERAVRMSKDALIAQEELDRSTMDHRVAQQELAEAKWSLDRAEIRAPFDGRITLRNVTLGQHIRPGDELFTVTNFQQLISRIYLPERDVLALDEGREVQVTLKADEKVRFRGRIRQISPVVDTATGTVKVTVEAIDPPSTVRPGGFVIIDIVRETHEDAIVLPREAVVRELQSAHVFVVKDDTAEKRAVELGLEEDTTLEIVSGLSEGERIVIAGQGGLKHGTKIKILENKPQAKARKIDKRPARSAV